MKLNFYHGPQVSIWYARTSLLTQLTLVQPVWLLVCQVYSYPRAFALWGRLKIATYFWHSFYREEEVSSMPPSSESRRFLSLLWPVDYDRSDAISVWEHRPYETGKLHFSLETIILEPWVAPCKKSKYPETTILESPYVVGTLVTCPNCMWPSSHPYQDTRLREVVLDLRHSWAFKSLQL